MEFEQMQKIWIEKTQETFYGVNENALYARITRKGESSQRTASFSEMLTIIVNLLAGSIILFLNYRGKGNTWLYITSAWMLVTACYAIWHRSSRQQLQPEVSLAIRDHLNQALHSAIYQVRLSLLMRLNIIPVAILISVSLWLSGKSPALVIGAPVFFMICFYFSGWEHRVYVRRKRELELLRDTLDEKNVYKA